MKTSELIKKAEELLAKCSDGPWKVSNYRPSQIIARSPNEGTYGNGDNNFSPLFYLEDLNAAHLIIFARNHMQELIDKLKKYEEVLLIIKTVLENKRELRADSFNYMYYMMCKALGDE